MRRSTGDSAIREGRRNNFCVPVVRADLPAPCRAPGQSLRSARMPMFGNIGTVIPGRYSEKLISA